MPLDKILGHGLSLAAEYRHHRNSTPSQGEDHVEDPKDRIKGPLVEEDEEDWQLDELNEHDHDSPSPPEYVSVGDYTGPFAQGMSENRESQLASGGIGQHRKLALPVIIPQRRPGSKRRGFVRAYAPALNDCGINQETFLHFLKDFHKSSQSSPWFTVVYISAAAAGFAPSVIAMAVSFAAMAGAQAAAEVQRRHRINNFLDQANETFFKPAGLFAMIIAYKPDRSTSPSLGSGGAVSVSSQVIEMGKDRLTAGFKEGSGSISSYSKKLQVSSGTTRGDAELPEFAPLVFPDADAAMQVHDCQASNGNAKSLQKFFQNYMDRRAQMNFAERNPNSNLVMPESQRNMRSNSTLGKLGSAIQNKQPKEEIFKGLLGGRANQTSADSSLGNARSASIPDQRRDSDRAGGLGMRRIMQENVLYLTIVNLPSHDEMAEASRALGL